MKQVEGIKELVGALRKGSRLGLDPETEGLMASLAAMQEKVEALERDKQRAEGEAEERERQRAEEKQELEGLKQKLREAEQLFKDEKGKYDLATREYRQKQEAMKKTLDEAAIERREWTVKMESMMANVESLVSATAVPAVLSQSSSSQQYLTQGHRFADLPSHDDDVDVQQTGDLFRSTNSVPNVSTPRSLLEESTARTAVMDIDFNDFINDTGEYTSNQAVEDMPDLPMSRLPSPAAASHMGSESDVDNDFTLGLQYAGDGDTIEHQQVDLAQDQPVPTLATDQEE
jgi:hypothetical protein